MDRFEMINEINKVLENFTCKDLNTLSSMLSMVVFPKFCNKEDGLKLRRETILSTINKKLSFFSYEHLGRILKIITITISERKKIYQTYEKTVSAS